MPALLRPLLAFSAGLCLAACGTLSLTLETQPAFTELPVARVTAAPALATRLVGTATALRLTAQAPASGTPSPTATPAPTTETAPPTSTSAAKAPASQTSPAGYAPVAITLSAQPIGVTDYVVAGAVRVSVEAPGAASVVFFVAPAGTGITPSPQFVDTEGGDGWAWTWTPPEAGWLGHVWAEVHYPDGYWQPTATLLTISPDGLGTPPVSPTPGEFASLTPPPPTLAPPAAPAELTAGLTYEADCDFRYNRRIRDWGINSPLLPSPDGRYLAQSVNTVETAAAGLRVTNADGSGEIWIPAPARGEPVDFPLWSPDGSWLLLNQVTLSQPGGGEIWIVRPDGAGLTWIARYMGYHDQLAWSPDGRYVAFSDGQVTGRGSGTQVIDYQVFLAPADGSGRRLLVAAGCNPAWGP